MGSEAENYAKWKVRSKIIRFATWLGVALSVAAVIATYLVPDISNTARLVGFLFLIVNAITCPAWLYLLVRTKLKLNEAKSRYDQAK